MPLTTGRYAEIDGAAGLAYRWHWLRVHTTMWARSRRRAPGDNGGGFALHREWGAWVLRPVTGWRSVRWITPAAHSTRTVPGDSKNAARDWSLSVLGM
ncbi:hypothetical protein ACLMAJ_19915 [Nocardia sp. KC 131]|uniref:hypothetical protein n=1 Tax=Nocardia arseniciresistens TaxID=3392119 RepID=UPI00398F4591